MNNIVLRTFGITKKYKNFTALFDINITIKKGEIYGLIGLNGAGKTTLMKSIAGLVKVSNGSIELFGETNKEEINKNRKKIGCLIEEPGLYRYKSIYTNLQIQRLHKGIPGEECIEKALDLLDLKEFKNKKIKNLSVGVKQRVGIAMAILGDPKFLILDEPINGLDPIAIVEFRELLKRLNKEYGTTILISSHILEELHQLADCYGIIHKGRVIEEITDEQLKNNCREFIHIKVDDISKASVVLNNKLSTLNFEVLPNNVIKLYDYVDKSSMVCKVLIEEGILVEQFMPMGESLEEYFSKIIGRK
ncbi:ABC transporter ATP-binding protein [Clostridium botulinum]|uniref:Bacitracin ABC transporter ATP-binding protein n=1 Tax=Clostridium botulinum C/D str. DC5 TaxID=1443128 RepID=A0A0A0IM87_CLOBO|nr:ABC transporter ATP-binding protein [Clostridium botulinum]KGM96471.1 bacitracin ABC transporter ATP-binding protein [Clostridium botulinum D str. CCUG 7971]KGN00671.1 bacitracin ABC transporter ATP-binding protein [Clostridium botulinum C/D str. DC5]KOC45749.1 bacitracin ABC transporter ATP-binding protein [Clostridium botulinum]KOC55501.1 bacitracin ABC transporter ATP-binding protein [Clostridium botulinum]KOC56297.1 bacitracin ABC transporter ATP-binding protein [Clostridium botulinum]